MFDAARACVLCATAGERILRAQISPNCYKFAVFLRISFAFISHLFRFHSSYGRPSEFLPWSDAASSGTMPVALGKRFGLAHDLK